MEKFNFDEINNRRGTFSMKWDSTPDPEVIPMWVADMDFKTAPCIIEALRKRVDQGIFGYSYVPDEYYEATIRWFAERHELHLEREWFIYTSGVIPALSATIKALTNPGDKVIVQTPVYNHFFSSIRNNKCEIVENRLIYVDNTYYIDYEDLEQKAADPKVKLMLLCNPHNPAGRVWSKEELTRIGEICLRHDVTVVSDEIHCELVYKPYVYTPFASISEEFALKSVTCCSPSKAFNIAGLQIANIFVADQMKRVAIDRAINDNEVCDVNPFGVIALIEAYNNGGEWLDQLVEYLHDNYLYMHERFTHEIPEFPICKLEGTYLAWVDCKVLNMGSGDIAEHLLADNKVWVNSGATYGDPLDRFIRVNLAAPRATIKKGIDRIITGLKQLLTAK